MSIVGGLSGYVNKDDSVVGSIQKWSVDYSGEPAAYVASSTKKGTVRLAGNTDWSGKYSALGGVPAIKPGELFKFEGSIDDTNGAASVSSGTISDGVVINWDIEGGGIITHEVSFSANGALTLGGVSGTTDNTLPPVDLSSLITVALTQSAALASPSYSTIENIRTMQLSITRANPSWVASTSGGVTKRVAGPWDAEFTYSLYEGDPAQLIVPGTVKMLKVFISTTKFWDLQYMRFGDIGGLEVDMETGDIVGANQTCKMEAFTDISDTMTEGKIADPNSVTWWP